jgi:hypothetical protein
MESGKIVISATGSVPCAIVEWYSEEKQEKGIFGRAKRKKIAIRDRKNGYFEGAYHCPCCHKIFGEFET